MVNVQTLVDSAPGPVVVLDRERRVVASTAGLGFTPGRRAPEELLGRDGVLVLYVEGPPALSAYEELRSGFTAAVSHELRTPLARLLALLESVELPGADPHELVEQARQEVDQIRELIDDVLFLGELETGREVVTLGTTKAYPILEAVVARLAERAAAADVTLRVQGNRLAEVPLRPRMLRVVAENLAVNALRYAGPGSRCILAVEQEPGAVVLRVSDDGAGVSAEDLPRLFERFYRADRARASRGTGLGLAIVKHVVTAAGGKVEARGAPGEGLEIRCSFPA